MGNPRAPICMPQYECPACPKRFHLPSSMGKHFTTQHPYQVGRVFKYSASPSKGNCPRSLQYRCKKDCPLEPLEGHENQTALPPFDLACLPYFPWRSVMKVRQKGDTTRTQAEELGEACPTHGVEGGIDFTWKTLCSALYSAFTDGLKTSFDKSRSRMDWRRPYLIDTEWVTVPTHAPFPRRRTGAITHSSALSPLFGSQLTSTTS